MSFSNIIELDIWSNFGCFSKPFSSTGGILSYLIPPKTSIIGMIGAILGYEFDDYSFENKNYKIECLNDIKLSVCPLFDLKTKRVTFNQVSGTTENLEILNVHQDVLINPKYKLFISFPDNLEDQESLFLERIKNNETIFNLYMGKNEFPLNLEFVREISFNSEIFDSNSPNLKDIRVFGSLNKKDIINVTLSYKNDEDTFEEFGLEGIIFEQDDDEDIRNLKSFYEYIIKDYPIKRENFTDFLFSPISFYSTDDFEKVFFSNIVLKEGCYLELVNIGDDKWLSLI